MNDKIIKKLYELDYIPEESDEFLNIYYDVIYFIKYLLNISNADIEKIKECSDDEYESVIKEELEDKSKDKLNNMNISNFWLYSFKKNHKELFDFIDKEIDLRQYDKNYPNWASYNDDYIDEIIDWTNCHKILSVFSVYTSKKKKDDTSVEVIFDMHQGGDIDMAEYRNEICGYKGYEYQSKQYPIDLNSNLNKKYINNYDFVYCDLIYGKDFLTKLNGWCYSEKHPGADFVGDNIYFNIKYLSDLLNDNGKAIMRVRYSDVSKMPKELIELNIIDEIVFMPKREDWDENGNEQLTNDVYIIVTNDKVNEEIILTDYKDKTRINITNNEIINNNGLINIEQYKKYDSRGYRIFNLKESNNEQFGIIANESKKIDKLLDEFDLK